MEPTDQLEGTVEQIVYYNPENGYAVCRFAAGGAKPVTIVGSFPPLSPGEVLKLKGAWEVNPKFGKQFHVESFSLALPASVQGIEKFLSSGLIKGIGPVLAGAHRQDLRRQDDRRPDREAREADGGRGRRRGQAPGDQEVLGGASGHPRPDHLPPGARRLDQPGDQDLPPVRRQGPSTSSRATRTSSAWTSGASGSRPPTRSPSSWAWTPPRRSGSRPSSSTFWRRTTSRATSSPSTASSGPSAGRRSRRTREAVDGALGALLPGSGSSSSRSRPTGRLPAVLPLTPRKRSSGRCRAGSGRLRSPRRSTSSTVVDEVEKDLGLVFSPTPAGRPSGELREEGPGHHGRPGHRQDDHHPGRDRRLRQMGQAASFWPRRRAGRPSGCPRRTGREAKTIHRILEFNPKQGTFRRNARPPAAGRGPHHRRVLHGRPGPDALSGQGHARPRCA